MREEIGLQIFLYENNIGTVGEYLERLAIDALVIPVGHADINTLRNLGYRNAEELEIPVFEAHKHFPGYRGYQGSSTAQEIKGMGDIKREEEVHKAFRKWVVTNFK